MRDPEGDLSMSPDWVYRRRKSAFDDGHFLRGAVAEEWVRNGRLVAYGFEDANVVKSPRVPFVSHPSEWCDQQLFDAAALTLDLAEALLKEQRELKDASAWNVIFDGCVPIFCDLFSAQDLKSKKWRAFGQFARHFLLPLTLSKHRGFSGYQSFRLWRDGLTPEMAANLLGWRRLFPRNALLLSQSTNAEQGVAEHEGEPNAQFSARLYSGLRWVLEGVAPRAVRSQWGEYEDQRTHYDGSSLESKRTIVRDWMHQSAPERVIDLGCNAGEFSRIALEAGAMAVCLDGDHEAIQTLYRSSQGERRLFPVLANLDDLSGGRGWEANEHPALLVRMQSWNADLVLVLALIHHLLTASIPAARVASFVASITRRFAIVEFIDETDAQLALLCRQRGRAPSEFSIRVQREAFESAGFAVVDLIEIPGIPRQLALLERKTP